MIMKTDIVFIDGLIPRYMSQSFLGYLFPLVAILEENHLSCKILNVACMKNYSIQGIIDELRDIEFSAIGMTTNADNIQFVYKVSDAIKHHYPNACIILGGPQVSYADKKTLQNCKCDVIIRGEGESQLVNVINKLKANLSFENIDGITYRDNMSICKNKDAKFLDINKLPTPQYGILNNKKYWIIPKGVTDSEFDSVLESMRKFYGFFMTGRGCPNHCVFCVEGHSKNSYRYRSAENVEKDLRYLLSVIDTDYIIIGDDTFTSSKKRVQELCDVFKKIQKTHKFRWFCEGRVDVISRIPEIISIMTDAGLHKLQVGIESGNQKTLDIYNKRITLEQLKYVITEASKYENLLIAGNIIMGNPHETFEEYKQGLEFIKELIMISRFCLDISYSNLTPYEGTPIRMNPSQYNLEILYEDFELKVMGMKDVICKPDTMTLDEVNTLYEYTDKEIMNLLMNNIFKLPVKFIIKRLLDHYSSTKIEVSCWSKTFFRMYSIHKFMRLRRRKTILDSFELTPKLLDNISPLRLWDLKYDFTEKHYSFVSLAGEPITLKGYEAKLWEKASGKQSLNQIHASINTMYKLDINKILSS